jgi:hypothetical protein
MAVKVSKETITTYTCDECGEQSIVIGDPRKDANAEPPPGIGGSVIEITGHGGVNADWWACKREHVMGAINTALINSSR